LPILDFTMNIIEELLQENVKLPSPPAIAVRILEAVKKDDASFDELARIISSDPALSVKVLRVANSAFYRMPKKVDSIQKALTILGINVLKNIALSFVIADGLRVTLENDFDFDLFWKRSVTAGVGAELLAARINYKNDDTFVTALLQDIGVAIMYLCKPEKYSQVLDEKKVTNLPARTIEKQIFGFDHQEVGSEILKDWGLPENICMPILYHHNDKEIPSEYAMLSHILSLSDKVSSVYYGRNKNEEIQNIKNILLGYYGISGTDVDTIVDSVALESVEILSYFDIDPGKMVPYSQLLQEANEELGKLNFSYEQLIMEYKEAKERAENLARELKSANDRLKYIAYTDELTDLYNHRYFHQLLETEFNRARRYGRPFSLIMFDLDDFKKVNDEFGHLRGDIVLKEMGAHVKRNVRGSDFVARYGGEEFAVILPETDSKGASVLAERLRKDIEKMRIATDGNKIKVTISVGVATYVPGSPLRDKSEIIGAADKALYLSKRTGKNKISAMELTSN
jgi:diguanylate cyclase (GGDEF)-like protein